MAGIQIDIRADFTKAKADFDALAQRLKQTGAAGLKFSNDMAAGANKAAAGLAKLPNASNQSTNALMNLSRVAQDAPYGFIGIANNINPLLESFQRLKATTGTTGGALKEMGKGLMGPAGLGLAVGVVSSLLVTFGDRLFGAKATMSKFSTVVSETKEAFTSAVKEVSLLRANIDLAKQGLISKEAVVKQYNDSIGKAAGSVKTLDEAEKGLVKNADAFIQVALQKAIANIAFAKQAEAEFKIVQNNLRVQSESTKQTGLFATAQDLAAKKVGRQNESLKKQADQYKDIGVNASKTAAEISKNFKFNELSIKPQKIKIEKPNKVELSDIKTEYELSSPITVKVPELKISAREMFPELNRFSDEGLANYDKGLWEAVDAWNKQQEQMKATANLLVNSLTPAFDELFSTITNSGGNAFKAMAEQAVAAITRIITKMLAMAAAAFIIGPLLGLGSAAGAASSKFGDVFKFLIGKRASGGPVSAGRPYVVGEVGRELFIPSTSGRIVPNNGLGGLLGGAMQLVNVTVNGRISGRDLVLVQAREAGYQTRNV